jgi:alanyl-tRNA synthetase
MFWKSPERKHVHLPEASLIADKDSTALFNLAGMQQLIPYLSGKKHPLGTRLYNIQKCVRTVDIDEVGDATHLTMFEMMGNWSLGDYFKQESIKRSREFLTSPKWLDLDPKKLAVTVFAGDDNAPRDDESANHWKQVGVSPDKISYLGVDDNWRSPWPVGPCGPDTEIFYRVGDSLLPPADSNVGSDPDNWMEIWNNVFMEYYRDHTGLLSKLPSQNVDTGMGFERICMVLQNKTSPYDTDIFLPAVEYVHNIFKSDTKTSDYQKRIRIIADHSRTALSLIAESIKPSNEWRGYVLRMLIRRMYYNVILCTADMSQTKLESLCEQLASCFYASEENKWVFIAEINQFQKTLDNGRKEFMKITSTVSNKQISGADAFKLYDTFGFPLELTKELAQEQNMTVNEIDFQDELQAQKQRSRQATKGKFTKDIDWSVYIQDIPTTQFIGYDSLEARDAKLLKDFEVNGHRVLIFDKTPFYAESGWQTGDNGTVTLDSGETLRVLDVKRYEGIFLHIVSDDVIQE